MSPPTIDLAMAARFLSCLDPDGAFTFQTFPEGGVEGAPQVLHGSFSDLAGILEAKNNLGHGIFVMVNKGDGQTHSGRRSCRTNANVVAVRAVFLDLDGPSPTPLLDANPPPAVVVESSPGRYHAYWFVRDCDLAEFSSTQKALASKFDGDEKVHDLARVMRIPGFIHRKGEPFLSRVLTLEDLR